MSSNLVCVCTHNVIVYSNDNRFDCSLTCRRAYLWIDGFGDTNLREAIKYVINLWLVLDVPWGSFDKVSLVPSSDLWFWKVHFLLWDSNSFYVNVILKGVSDINFVINIKSSFLARFKLILILSATINFQLEIILVY